MKTHIGLITILGILYGCDENDLGNGSGSSNGGGNSFSIPNYEIYDGGPGKDGIPALENPELVNVDDASNSYLKENDFILGIKHDSVIVGYPHPILDWHEIINDDIGHLSVSVTYCPLTGTGIGWDRNINKENTTFGVSGLLYNSNLIPYDRATDSYWSQIGLESIGGDLVGNLVKTIPVVELDWATWKLLFPNSKVVSINTGYSRTYGFYPYGDYKTNNDYLIFPVDPYDDRLPEKERVHAIIINNKAFTYRFENFTGNNLIYDTINNLEVIVVGNSKFIVSFVRAIPFNKLTFSYVYNNSDIILTDNEGNSWNVFGKAINGPRQGEKLQSTVSFMAYWFSIGAFYPGAEIYGM